MYTVHFLYCPKLVLVQPAVPEHTKAWKPRGIIAEICRMHHVPGPLLRTPPRRRPAKPPGHHHRKRICSRKQSFLSLLVRPGAPFVACKHRKRTHANTQTWHHRSISRNHVQDLDGLPSVTTREQHRLGRLNKLPQSSCEARYACAPSKHLAHVSCCHPSPSR